MKNAENTAENTRTVYFTTRTDMESAMQYRLETRPTAVSYTDQVHHIILLVDKGRVSSNSIRKKVDAIKICYDN
jgi:hypothetical protein